MSYNRVILMGNLTADPELKYTPKGAAVCDFNLAINRTWKDQDGHKHEGVDYIGVIAWGKQAELVGQYFRMGRELMLEGRLSQESWEDKNTGQKRSKTRVVLEKLVFLSSGGAREKRGSYGNSGQGSAAPRTDTGQAPAAAGSGYQGPEDDDDVPF